jgi:hypothetical protein
MVREPLPEARVMPHDRRANVVQGRVFGRATGNARLRWFMVTQPGQFTDVGFSWYQQPYGCAVHPDDTIWLHEAMVGIDYKSYRDSF